MTDSDTQSSRGASEQQRVVDRLVFAALREQTRARRWRIFFTLFFIVYLTVVTIILLGGGGDGLVSTGGKHTALVRMSGVIASGEEAGAENIIDGLKSAFENDDTVGVVLEIDSPGGSPVQSAYIYDEILRLRQKHAKIPLYVVVTDIAASGGYFVAAAADKIYVNKSSLVGSIGVRMGSFGFVGLMDKLGVERRLLTAGKNKGLFDPFLPEKSEEKAHLQRMLDQVHGHFIDAVRRGRGDRLVETDDIFSGLFWTGEKALELGLADAYGTRYSVARELGAEHIVDFTPRTDLFQRIAQRIGISAGKSIGETLSGGLRIE